MYAFQLKMGEMHTFHFHFEMGAFHFEIHKTADIH